MIDFNINFVKALGAFLLYKNDSQHKKTVVEKTFFEHEMQK